MAFEFGKKMILGTGLFLSTLAATAQQAVKVDFSRPNDKAQKEALVKNLANILGSKKTDAIQNAGLVNIRAEIEPKTQNTKTAQGHPDRVIITADKIVEQNSNNKAYVSKSYILNDMNGNGEVGNPEDNMSTIHVVSASGNQNENKTLTIEDKNSNYPTERSSTATLIETIGNGYKTTIKTTSLGIDSLLHTVHGAKTNVVGQKKSPSITYQQETIRPDPSAKKLENSLAVLDSLASWTAADFLVDAKVFTKDQSPGNWVNNLMPRVEDVALPKVAETPTKKASIQTPAVTKDTVKTKPPAVKTPDAIKSPLIPPGLAAVNTARTAVVSVDYEKIRNDKGKKYRADREKQIAAEAGAYIDTDEMAMLKNAGFKNISAHLIGDGNAPLQLKINAQKTDSIALNGKKKTLVQSASFSFTLEDNNLNGRFDAKSAKEVVEKNYTIGTQTLENGKATENHYVIVNESAASADVKLLNNGAKSDGSAVIDKADPASANKLENVTTAFYQTAAVIGIRGGVGNGGPIILYNFQDRFKVK